MTEKKKDKNKKKSKKKVESLTHNRIEIIMINKSIRKRTICNM